MLISDWLACDSSLYKHNTTELGPGFGKFQRKEQGFDLREDCTPPHHRLGGRGVGKQRTCWLNSHIQRSGSIIDKYLSKTDNQQRHAGRSKQEGRKILDRWLQSVLHSSCKVRVMPSHHAPAESRVWVVERSPLHMLVSSPWWEEQVTSSVPSACL